MLNFGAGIAVFSEKLLGKRLKKVFNLRKLRVDQLKRVVNQRKLSSISEIECAISENPILSAKTAIQSAKRESLSADVCETSPPYIEKYEIIKPDEKTYYRKDEC